MKETLDSNFFLIEPLMVSESGVNTLGIAGRLFAGSHSGSTRYLEPNRPLPAFWTSCYMYAN